MDPSRIEVGAVLRLSHKKEPLRVLAHQVDRGELLHGAAAIQAPHLGSEPPTGMGIFRSGLQRGIPPTTCGGHESRLHDHIAV